MRQREIRQQQQQQLQRQVQLQRQQHHPAIRLPPVGATVSLIKTRNQIQKLQKKMRTTSSKYYTNHLQFHKETLALAFALALAFFRSVSLYISLSLRSLPTVRIRTRTTTTIINQSITMSPSQHLNICSCRRVIKNAN